MASQDEHSFGKGFSILLKHYRRAVRGWTQKELAIKSGLKIRTIQDLETAQKAKLDHETVAKLATVFDLQGDAKEEFFGAAGLASVALSSDEVEWNRVIFEFHKSVDFPAFVGDELTQIHSANSYILELLEVNLETLSAVVSSKGGLNIMHFLFDPTFNARKLYGQQWKSYVTTNVWFLRHMSRPHIYKERYQRLLNELNEFEDFVEIWDATKDLAMPLPPYLGTVRSQKYGAVRFWHSTSLRPNTNGEQFNFLFYHPADAESERTFAQLRADVPKIAYQLSNTRSKGVVRLF